MADKVGGYLSVLKDFAVRKFNPYHDFLGRFSSQWFAESVSTEGVFRARGLSREQLEKAIALYKPKLTPDGKDHEFLENSMREIVAERHAQGYLDDRDMEAIEQDFFGMTWDMYRRDLENKHGVELDVRNNWNAGRQEIVVVGLQDVNRFEPSKTKVAMLRKMEAAKDILLGPSGKDVAVEVFWTEEKFDHSGVSGMTGGEYHAPTWTDDGMNLNKNAKIRVAGFISDPLGVMAHEVQHHKYYLGTVIKFLPGNKDKGYIGNPVDIWHRDSVPWDKNPVTGGRDANDWPKALPKYADTGGITEYSKEWWDAAKRGDARAEQAVNETLAEIAYLGIDRKTGKVPSQWMDLYKTINTQYDAEFNPLVKKFELSSVLKANPFHDELGKFSTRDNDADGVPRGGQGYNSLLESSEKLLQGLGGFEGTMLQGYVYPEYAINGHINKYLRKFGDDFESDNDLAKTLREEANTEIQEYLEEVESDDPADIGKTVKAIDKLISQSTTTDDMTLYRAIPIKIKGDTYEERSFVSTSHNREYVDGFAKHQLGEGTIVEMKVPKGANALALATVGGMPWEAEVLLPRNSKFKVLSRSTKTIDGQDFDYVVTALDTSGTEKKGDVVKLEFSFVLKANPFHDEKGRFSTKDKARSGGPKEPADDASHEEWENYLSEKFPATDFRLHAMSMGLLKDFARQYVSLAEKYPWAAANVDEVGLFENSDMAAIAYVEQSMVMGSEQDVLRFDYWRIGDQRISGGYKNIVDPPDSEKEVRSELQHSEKTKFAPESCGNFTALVTHEFGHIIDDVLSNWKLSGGQLARDWKADKQKMWESTFWNGRGSFAEAIPKLLRQPSDYAKKNSNEMFAEAFSEAEHNPYFSDKSLKFSPRNETVTANAKKMLAWYSEWKTTGVMPTRPKDWLPEEVKP